MATGSKQTFFDILRFAIITLLIVIPVRAYVAQPFIVSGISMDPTYKNGEYLIVDELSYHFQDPKRGEVVVFRYPKDPSKFFIKRVIGLPGETVSISGSSINITTSAGEELALEEPYIDPQDEYQPTELTLKKEEYFVMGDNRDSSLDSRAWGPVTETAIKGRVALRLLPLTKVNLFPGDYSGSYITTLNQ